MNIASEEPSSKRSKVYSYTGVEEDATDYQSSKNDDDRKQQERFVERK